MNKALLDRLEERDSLAHAWSRVQPRDRLHVNGGIRLREEDHPVWIENSGTLPMHFRHVFADGSAIVARHDMEHWALAAHQDHAHDMDRFAALYDDHIASYPVEIAHALANFTQPLHRRARLEQRVEECETEARLARIAAREAWTEYAVIVSGGPILDDRRAGKYDAAYDRLLTARRASEDADYWLQEARVALRTM